MAVAETVKEAFAQCLRVAKSKDEEIAALGLYDAMSERLSQFEAERDEARKIAKEFEAWLAQALDALGVDTVFEIEPDAMAKVERQLDEARAALERMQAAYHEELEAMFGTEFADKRIRSVLSPRGRDDDH